MELMLTGKVAGEKYIFFEHLVRLRNECLLKEAFLPLDKGGIMYKALVASREMLVREGMVLKALQDPMKNPLYEASVKVQNYLLKIDGGRIPKEQIDKYCRPLCPFVKLESHMDWTYTAINEGWDEALEVLVPACNNIRASPTGSSAAGRGVQRAGGAARRSAAPKGGKAKAKSKPRASRKRKSH
jgi:hypothetical protein